MNTGVRTFEVYLVDEKPYGYEIEKPYPISTHGYEFAFTFFGKNARIVIVSNDGDIDRSIALYFAKAIAFKNIRGFRIDLVEAGLWTQNRRKK